MKKALVCGGGGFIGNHMVSRLKREGFWVRAVDLKYPEFSQSEADEFAIADLREPGACSACIDQSFDEIYQFAADMGGAGYIFTKENDANIMASSASININVLQATVASGSKRIFYSSSACIYPEHNQVNPENPICAEESAYPANPDSDYGWEKLFSERLYLAFQRNHGIEVRIARYHNIFGPLGTWRGGREKAPAAMCRKLAMVADGGEIEVWGDGSQTRSFLYIDECLEGTLRVMRSPHVGPFNVGSAEIISINDLAQMVADIAGKSITLKHTPGPLGVRGRTSDNVLIRQTLGWAPSYPLRDGLTRTYRWIEEQVRASEQ
ncbi:MAG: NAD-dependent epimerase/dehydratase family protein [Rhodocyclaceae bacterium]